MDEREGRFFENEPFLAALYLDPRFHDTLEDAQLKRAENHLVDLYDRMKNLKDRKNRQELVDKELVDIEGKVVFFFSE